MIHSYLHSFPTRRSSDLAARRREIAGHLVAPRPLERMLRDRHELDVRVAHVVDVLDQLVRQDRKSTRLNSSHTVISYAVFCLKKKMTDEKSTTVNTSSAA